METSCLVRQRYIRKVCPSLCLTLSNGHVQRAGGQGAVGMAGCLQPRVWGPAWGLLLSAGALRHRIN